MYVDGHTNLVIYYLPLLSGYIYCCVSLQHVFVFLPIVAIAKIPSGTYILKIISF